MYWITDPEKSRAFYEALGMESAATWTSSEVVRRGRPTAATLGRRRRVTSDDGASLCFRDVVEFRILGPVEILDGERVVPLGGLKRRAVVAVLLLHPNRVVPSAQLIDLVWGDDPPAAALGSLQNHVLRLRRELGDRLVTRPRGYLLRVEPGELDVDRFRTLEHCCGSRTARGSPDFAARQPRQAREGDSSVAASVLQ
jgi:hypothetical protein